MDGRSTAPAWVIEWARSRSGRKGRIRDGKGTNRDKDLGGQFGPRPDWLAQTWSWGVSERLARAALPAWSEEEEARLCSALAVIPADDRSTWIPYGGAIHDWYGGSERGFAVFHRWSMRGGDKYKGEADCAYTWRSFDKPYSGIPATVASIYADARARGWVEPSVNAGIVNGIASVAGVLPTAISANPIQWPDLGRGNRPKPTCENTRVAIRHLGIECRYDLFHDRQRVNGQEIKEWQGELADNTILAIRAKIRENWQLEPALGTVREAVATECLKHTYDPVLDYLDSLRWDGRPRLRSWLHTYMGAEDSALNRMIGGLALTAAVRRARQPGCKFDHVIVLEGKENIGKSSAIEIMAGRENFSDQAILAEKEQRQMELLQGVWLYELAELSGQKRAEVEHAKAFITRSTDRGRKAYGHFVEHQPRHCVLFATCNDNRYLVSQTGNRRYLSAGKCRWIDQDRLRADRDQLWAEASMIEARGVPLWLPEEFWPAAQEMQESRRMQDPWEDMLYGIEKMQKKGVWEIENEYRIATESLMGAFLDIPGGQRNSVHNHRLGTVMRILGWEGPKPVRIRLLENERATVVKKGFSKPVTAAARLL